MHARFLFFLFFFWNQSVIVSKCVCKRHYFSLQFELRNVGETQFTVNEEVQTT